MAAFGYIFATFLLTHIIVNFKDGMGKADCITMGNGKNR